jgi:hypothetical protein
MTTTVNDKTKKVKAVLGFGKMSDADLVKRMDAIRDGMTGNAAFPNPPVDMASYKTAVDTYNTLVTEALDGGKKAVSAKQKQREVVIQMTTLLGHYVEVASNNDLATFNTSGFVAQNNTRTPPQPLTGASIKYVDRGPNTGQVVLRPAPLKGVLVFDLQYSPVPAAGAAPNWVSLTLTGSKAVTVSNLTPGTNYQFQIRGLGRLGYSDWSDPVTFLCA